MKFIKEFFAFPFFILFYIGLCIAITGWIFIELITGEKLKEIKIVKDTSAVDSPKNNGESGKH